MTTTIRIILDEKNSSLGKVAEAEMHFVGGLLDRLKLIGFAVWTRRSAAGFNVTFPARQYSVNGERRSFALLRPTGNDPIQPQDRIRDLIIDAYRRTEQHPDITAWTYDDDGRCTIESIAPAPTTTDTAPAPSTAPTLF